jgi:hypothetical protein
MFLVEEKKSEDRQCSAAIYMRSDGLFEGRIYRGETVESAEFEVCGVAETLPRMETIVDEMLGL